MINAPRMKKPRLRVTDLNPCLSCILCGGYFIDATTITECLHSFCRACIVRYLETSKYCPVCDVRVHKTRPLRCIRPDKMLQDIVYKLVPGLYQNEMKGRRDLYASQPPEAILASRDEEDRGEGMQSRFIYTAEEILDLTIEYQHKKRENGGENAKGTNEEVTIRRYLRCPAAFRISHLKKFIRLKYSIPPKLQVAILHQDELLEDEYSLMDVAYITSWKREGPLKFTFDVQERPKIQPRYTFSSNVHATKAATNENIVHAENKAEVNQVAEADLQSSSMSLKEDDSSNNTASESANMNVVTPATHNDASEMPVAIPTEAPVVKEHAKKQKCDSDSEAKTMNSSSSGHGRIRSASGERSRKHMKHKSRRKRKSSASIKTCSVSSLHLDEFSESPPKVPKLTISLTPKILQMAAQHAEEDKMDLNSELYEGRLVISEPDKSPKESEGYCSDNAESPKIVGLVDLESEKKNEEEIVVDDDEVDSGRGSDGSSRVENDDIGSPLSSIVLTPDLEKPDTFLLPSPSPLPSPSVNIIDDVNECKVNSESDISKPSDDIPTLVTLKKDDLGVLDLSTCSIKRTDVSTAVYRSKPVANPPVLDKFRQTNPVLPMPMVSSYKLLPTVFAHSGNFKKTDYSPGNFRYNRGNSFTVINPDPSSCRPKIVIKNLDAAKPAQRHHHHHHHHHHHNHHQKV